MSGFSLLGDVDWSSKRCKEVGMLRSGILSGRKETEEGIVAVIRGLTRSSPVYVREFVGA